MFPLISSITHQQQQQSAASFSKQPTNQKTHQSPLKTTPFHQKPLPSFSKSLIASGKEEGGATVLWEGRDIVIRET
jgi:hypothetical protein